MKLTSLFDTFVPGQEFGELIGPNGVDDVDSEPWMNDSLFGFMNAVDGIQGSGDADWNEANGSLPGSGPLLLPNMLTSEK
jgi:hypothetical protein